MTGSQNLHFNYPLIKFRNTDINKNFWKMTFTNTFGYLVFKCKKVNVQVHLYREKVTLLS